MIKDPRSKALSDNFAGQWLRARDIENMEIEPISALGLKGELKRLKRELSKMRRERQPTRRRCKTKKPTKKQKQKTDDAKKDDEKQEARWQEREKVRAEYRRIVGLSGMFNSELRQAMRDETLAYFEYIVHENRDVTELIDSNYTFVNETLAKHYGIEGVKGEKMRRVELPAGSPRGGVLTQGTFLGVTSNPSRTSPVKRGLFILDNILGSPPPPPPPPNVPLLEVARDSISGHQPTIREVQELHRREPLCKSCHARMDPLGLALREFQRDGNVARYRARGADRCVGELMTGEKFAGIRELKIHYQRQAPARFLPMFVGKVAYLRPGAGFGVL